MIYDDPTKGEDMNEDHNQIVNLLYIHYSLRTLKLVVIIFNLVYFLGMLWIIFCDVTHQYLNEIYIFD
jgi:uncharacterized protein with PQ loop repeat